MKTVKKNVYYCAFCKKRGLSSGAMTRHELHCTANPFRECRLCERIGINDMVDRFLARYRLTTTDTVIGGVTVSATIPEWIGEPVTLQEIRNAVDDCPNCILAILRQCGFVKNFTISLEPFDYKAELEEYWKEKNSEAYNEYLSEHTY